jgi:hypothetical protein
MTLEQAKRILEQARAIAPEHTDLVMTEAERIAKTAGKRVVRVLDCLRDLADALTVDQ